MTAQQANKLLDLLGDIAESLHDINMDLCYIQGDIGSIEYKMPQSQKTERSGNDA